MSRPRPHFTLSTENDVEGEAHELEDQGNSSRDNAHDDANNNARERESPPEDSAPPTSSSVKKRATGPSEILPARIPGQSKLNAVKSLFNEQLSWVKPNLNWKSMRVVIRSAIAAWCGLILMLDKNSQKVLGQASFLILVGTC
jgi:hypothetical protein